MKDLLLKAQHTAGKPDTFHLTAEATDTPPRPLYVIAADIRRTWRKKDGTPSVNYAAIPYLEAMEGLNLISDKYYYDSAASILRYFLGNATAWRGDDARRIKAELKALLASPDASAT